MSKISDLSLRDIKKRKLTGEWNHSLKSLISYFQLRQLKLALLKFAFLQMPFA